MRLLDLRLTDFRNFRSAEVALAPFGNVAVGANGQGKTNLIEAIYLLCALRPLRARKLSELVHFEATEAQVKGRVEIGGAEREIRVHLTGGLREAFIDGKRADKLESYLDGLAVIAFTPDDLSVVKGPPEGRRALLDRAVFNRFPTFLGESRRFARALKARNRLLKERAASAYLEAYDGPLASAGARVWARRRQVLWEIGPRASAAFERLAGAGLPTEFRYRPVGAPEDWMAMDEPALEQALLDGLTSDRQVDLIRGYTTFGPQADDLAIGLADHSARSFASQGQQRALVLAWKMAEIENLQAACQVNPILLLDDVLSELDLEKNHQLTAYLAAREGQYFLTTTDAAPTRAPGPHKAKWYRIHAGRITVKTPESLDT